MQAAPAPIAWNGSKQTKTTGSGTFTVIYPSHSSISEIQQDLWLDSEDDHVPTNDSVSHQPSAFAQFPARNRPNSAADNGQAPSNVKPPQIKQQQQSIDHDGDDAEVDFILNESMYVVTPPIDSGDANKRGVPPRRRQLPAQPKKTSNVNSTSPAGVRANGGRRQSEYNAVAEEPLVARTAAGATGSQVPLPIPSVEETLVSIDTNPWVIRQQPITDPQRKTPGSASMTPSFDLQNRMLEIWNGNDNVDGLNEDTVRAKELQALLENERRINRGYAKAIETLQGVLEMKNDDLRQAEEKLDEADEENSQLMAALHDKANDISQLNALEMSLLETDDRDVLKDKLKQLLDQLKLKNFETKALQKEVLDRKKQAGEFEASLKKEHDEIKALLKSLEKVQQVVNRKNEEIQVLDMKINDSENSRRKLLNDKLAAEKAAKAQLENVQQALKEKTMELGALEEKLQQHSLDKALTQADLDVRDENVKQLKAQIDELKSNLDEKQAVIAAKETEELRAAREQARLEAKLELNAAEIDALKKKISEQDEKLNSNTRRSDDLENETRLQKQQSYKLESAAKLLKDDVDARTGKISELEQLLSTTQESCKKLANELEAERRENARHVNARDDLNRVISDKDEELKELDRNLKARESYCTKLLDEKAKNERIIEQNNSNLEDLKRTIKDRDEELGKLKEALSNEKTARSELLREKRKLEDLVADLTDKLRSTENKYELTGQEKSRLATEIVAQKQAMKDLQHQIDNLQGQIEKKTLECDKLMSELASLQQKNAKLTEDVNDALKKNKEVQDALNQAQLDMEKKDKDHKKTMDSLQDSEAAVKKLEDDKSALQKQIDQLRETIRTLENEKEELAQKMILQEKYSAENKEEEVMIKAKVSSLESSLAAKDEELAAVRESAQSLEKEKKKVLLDVMMKMKEMDLIKQANKIPKVDDEKESLKVKFQTLTAEHESLTEKVAKLEKEIEELHEAKGQLEHDKLTIQTKSAEEIEETAKQTKKLLDENEAMQKNAIQTQEKLSAVTLQAKEQENELKAKRQELTRAEDEIRQLKAKIQELKNEKDDIVKIKNSLQAELADVRENLNTVEFEKQDNLKKLTRAQQEIAKLDSTLKEKEAEIQALLEKQAQTELDNETAKGKLKKLDTDIKNLLHEKTLLDEELRTVSEKLDDEVTKHKLLAKEAQEKDAKHKATLVTCKLYESEADRLQIELVKKGDELKVAQDKVAELKGALKSLDKKFTDSERQLQSTSDKLIESESENKRLVNQVQRAEGDLKIAAAKLAVADNVMSSMNVVRTTEELERSSQAEKIKVLQGKNALMQEECQLLEKQLDEQRQKLDITQRMLQETKALLDLNAKVQSGSGKDLDMDRARREYNNTMRALENELRGVSSSEPTSVRSSEELEVELHKKATEMRYLNLELDLLKKKDEKDETEKRALVSELELLRKVANEIESNKQYFLQRDTMFEENQRTLENTIRELHSQKLTLMNRLYACEEDLARYREQLGLGKAGSGTDVGKRPDSLARMNSKGAALRDSGEDNNPYSSLTRSKKPDDTGAKDYESLVRAMDASFNMTSPPLRDPSTNRRSRPLSQVAAAATYTEPPTGDAPDPPERFIVLQALVKDVYIFSWIPPPMNDKYENRGFTVVGYKLTVDQRTSCFVRGPSSSKVLVRGGGADVTQPHTFTLQTVVSPGNQLSPAAVIAFPGNKAAKTRLTKWDTDLPWTDITPNSGRKLWLALHDYTPSTTTGSYDNKELALTGGDFVVTTGVVRSDGFYQAKLQGRTGYVPAYFLSHVPIMTFNDKDGAYLTSDFDNYSS